MEIPRYITIKEFLVDTPTTDPKGIFLLAHGAGMGMANPFMDTFAKGARDAGVRVVRFHFPYMEEMLRTGRKQPPNGGRILRQCFSELIIHCIEKEQCPGNKIILGGKSMGSRVATMIADEHHVAGVICLGYPFHPPKQPEKLRINHLRDIQTPTLICQGECDPFGNREEIRPDSLSYSIKFHWITAGTHSFEPLKSSGRTITENLQDAVCAVNRFIEEVLGPA